MLITPSSTVKKIILPSNTSFLRSHNTHSIPLVHTRVSTIYKWVVHLTKNDFLCSCISSLYSSFIGAYFKEKNLKQVKHFALIRKQWKDIETMQYNERVWHQLKLMNSFGLSFYKICFKDNSLYLKCTSWLKLSQWDQLESVFVYYMQILKV